MDTKKTAYCVDTATLSEFKCDCKRQGLVPTKVIAAFMDAFSSGELLMVSGKITPKSTQVSLNSYQTTPPESPKPRGRPPKEDESWKEIPGCAGITDTDCIKTWKLMPPKVQKAIIADNDTNWWPTTAFENNGVPYTEDTYIRKHTGLPVSHVFLGDKV